MKLQDVLGRIRSRSSAHSLSVLNREFKGSNKQSIKNTSYDMYFSFYDSYDDMIKECKDKFIEKNMHSKGV